MKTSMNNNDIDIYDIANDFIFTMQEPETGN